MKRKVKRLMWIAPAAILGMVLFSFIGGDVVKLLWNWLMPALFGWQELTFWQALGMLALCRILFGGFGMNSSGRSNSRRRMRERLEHMTPEERERFREGVRGRLGFEPTTGRTTEL
jgi:uncharacterized membrane protein